MILFYCLNCSQRIINIMQNGANTKKDVFLQGKLWFCTFWVSILEQYFTRNKKLTQNGQKRIIHSFLFLAYIIQTVLIECAKLNELSLPKNRFNFNWMPRQRPLNLIFTKLHSIFNHNNDSIFNHNNIDSIFNHDNIDLHLPEADCSIFTEEFCTVFNKPAEVNEL